MIRRLKPPTPLELEALARDRFLNDTETHVLGVKLDEGLHRHLQFRNKAGGSFYWFDIITAPGLLVLDGDMGTWAFRQWGSTAEDMFAFFRSNPDRPNSINTHYWAEKLIAKDRHGGPFEYDSMDMRETVRQIVSDYAEGIDDDTVRAAFLRAALTEVLHQRLWGDGEHREIENLMEWEFSVGDGTGEIYRPFRDLWDYGSSERPTVQFLWSLHAIVHGIALYDAEKGQ